MNGKLWEIINHYGVNKQLKYFQSEVFELSEAILNHEILRKELHGFKLKEAKKELIDNITEEIADVLVMLEQFKLYYDILEEEVQEIMEEKVDRQLNRIREEREENE